MHIRINKAVIFVVTNASNESGSFDKFDRKNHQHNDLQ